MPGNGMVFRSDFLQALKCRTVPAACSTILLASTLLLLTAYISTPFEPRHKTQSYWKDLNARLLTHRGSPPPAAWFHAIEEDLRPWKLEGVSRAQVEAAYCSAPGYGFRIQIKNGKIFILGETPSIEDRHRNIKMMLLHLQGLHQLPDLDIGHFGSEDSALEPRPSKQCRDFSPIFTFAKRPSDAYSVRFPDWNFFDWPNAHLLPWEDLSNVMREHCASMPWTKRLAQLFGRAAGLGPTRAVLLENQEELSKNPLWQVRIVDWKEQPGEWVSLLRHCKYKFLLHVPGFTYSGRLKFLTMCGSAIVFPQDPWQEFWYPMLQNASNIYFTEAVTPDNQGLPLLQAAQHLEADDDLAARLAAGAWTLAYEVLTKQNINLYIQELFKNYAGLLKFDVAIHPDAIPLEESLMGEAITRERHCEMCSKKA